MDGYGCLGWCGTRAYYALLCFTLFCFSLLYFALIYFTLLYFERQHSCRRTSDWAQISQNVRSSYSRIKFCYSFYETLHQKQFLNHVLCQIRRQVQYSLSPSLTQSNNHLPSPHTAGQLLAHHPPQPLSPQNLTNDDEPPPAFVVGVLLNFPTVHHNDTSSRHRSTTGRLLTANASACNSFNPSSCPEQHICLYPAASCSSSSSLSSRVSAAAPRILLSPMRYVSMT